MELNEKQQSLLRMIPGVDYIIEITKRSSFFDNIPRSVLIRCIRQSIEAKRNAILNNDSGVTELDLSDTFLLDEIRLMVKDFMRYNLRRTVNATGIVVHTNLGRSILPDDAIKNLTEIAGSYSNLEFDLSKGKRGSRYTCVEEIICELSSAEAAMVVNNNAAAVLLCLETLAKGKKVIVSRGELVEIGGSFRIPDVMSRSGCILNEIGTTNRTHLKDYENAIENETGLLLKVHTSNYAIVGFTTSVELKDLIKLGQKHNIPVMEDLGSGTFIDFSQFGLKKEPTIRESVTSGADIVTFSGDKLLGGPQSGIIVGKKKFLDKIKQNPLTRALRIDKLTLAALESTLRLYLEPKKVIDAIPTLRMLTIPYDVIEKKAIKLKDILDDIKDKRLVIDIVNVHSKAGGGSLPLLLLPSKCIGITIKGLSPNLIETYLRQNVPPVIGRIEEDIFLMDIRTIQDDEFPIIQYAIETMLKRCQT